MKNSIVKTLTLLITGVILLTLTYSCRTSHQTPMTQKLFMQYKRVNIAYPNNDGNNGKGAVLSEQITYSTKPDTTALTVADNQNQLDTNKVYSLSGVTVASKLRFTSMREGYVNVDFVINVPQELISDDYRMLLTPELMYGDTTVLLDPVILVGKNFVEKQKQDYQNYENYLSTIIPNENYDSTFLDVKGIAKDMKQRQLLYWNLYNKENDRVLKYWKWRNQMQERYNYFNTQKEIKYRETYHKYQREGNYAAIVKMTQRKDTAGTSEIYNDKFKKRVKRNPMFKIDREITEKTVPKKYRDLFNADTRPTDVQNFAVTELDSIDIAKHRYFFDKIVENEMKDSLRENVFRQMVPYQQVEKVKYSITLNEPQNFTYLYTQEYPVKPGMKNILIHLKGRIDATDQTGYTLPRTDTLSYLISSLEELADSTLLRQNSSDAKYREGYDFLINRDYIKAMKILGEYNDYNMALSLACQGYNQQAYALLKRQPQTALTHYLNAIVSSRLNRKTEAVTSLEKACQLNTVMIYRCMRDTEIKKLITDFKLQERLENIELMSIN